MSLHQHDMASPVGRLTLVTDGEALVALEFEGYEERLARYLARRFAGRPVHPATAPGEAAARLAAYFDGDVKALDAVRTAALGTPFQLRVWTALREIPAGATISYGELARRLGAPGASRAVGLANGANPIPIVVPCHRVIGASGRLTGFGGGLPRKQWLLAHEVAGRQGRLAGM